MKLTLSDVDNIIDASTAETTINNNSAAIETAFENTLSRDGTAPNQMLVPLDMNSNQIINLSAPLSTSSPLRLADANTLNGGGTIQSIPSGGTTGQALKKNSNVSYDVSWGNTVSSVGLAMPADFTVTNTPVTSSGTLTASWATTPTGTGSVVRTTSPTIVTPSVTNGTFTSPTLVTAALGTPASGTLTNCTSLPISTGVSGLAAGVSAFLVTPSSANLATAITDETGTGSLVFANTPSLTTPNIIGTTAGGNAAAGSVGEYVSSVIASGSAVALTSGVSANVTSISLTAGDWDVEGAVITNPAATTSITAILGSTSLVSATIDPTYAWSHRMAAFVPAAPFGGYGVARQRVSVNTTTTVYLVVSSTFTVSTNAAYGYINARRVR